MGNWLDALKGPSLYRANTPWSPAAAIGAVAAIMLVGLTLPLILYGLSPELYKVTTGELDQPKMIWSQTKSSTLALLQQIVAGSLIWIAAGLGNGTRRAVLSLPPLKGKTYTYLALALLVFAVWIPLNIPVAGISASSPLVQSSINNGIESCLAFDERTDSHAIG